MHNPECVQEVSVLTGRRLRGEREKKEGGGSGAGEKWNIGTWMNGWLMCGKEKDRCLSGSETYFQKKENLFQKCFIHKYAEKIKTHQEMCISVNKLTQEEEEEEEKKKHC